MGKIVTDFLFTNLQFPAAACIRRKIKTFSDRRKLKLKYFRIHSRNISKEFSILKIDIKILPAVIFCNNINCIKELVSNNN